jgi:riboflavin synthase alpha subunit
MFTGVIESLGTVASVERSPAGIRLVLDADVERELTPGDSLAVNGVCLTVVASDRPGIHADVSPETARVTTLGSARPGLLVNLERSMRADARVGGHFVQGHVDATGRIDAIEQEGDAYRVRVSFPAPLAPLLVHKGSIAVDGISLTIASLDGDRFDVQIIPHTWERTNLHAVAAGDAVNLECDILGKYVARALELRGGVPPSAGKSQP